MNSDESDLFDELPLLEACLNRKTMTDLVHIAGYVSRNNLSHFGEDTHDYYEQYGRHSRALERGGLAVAGDKLCQ